MSTFMEMKKTVSKMTTFSLTIYHPLLREQILLAIMNALGKSKRGKTQKYFGKRRNISESLE